MSLPKLKNLSHIKMNKIHIYIDINIWGSLRSNPLAAPTPTGFLEHAPGSGSSGQVVPQGKNGGPKPKPKPPANPKPKAVPKAKTPVQEATAVFRLQSIHHVLDTTM